MHILHTTPKTDGFSMPAEFERHAGCLLIWPERGDSWRSGGWPARKAFVAVASAIAQSETVTMLVSPAQYETARAMLPPEIRLVEMETDDSWARDVCPTFVRSAAGGIRGIDWGFNAWGGLEDGLYFPWDKDNHVARKVCDLFWTDTYDSRDFILEGGSIHSDGEGTILTTESCLCSAGRNPQMTKAEITEKLCVMLGAEKVLWLPRGIYGDETNEHVDNVCAFTAPGKVVLAWTDNENDPQYAERENLVEWEDQIFGEMKGIGITNRFKNNPSQIVASAPCFGEHNREVLQEFGYTDKEIDDLYKKGEIVTWTPADTARIRHLPDWGFFWDTERQCERIGMEWPLKDE